MDIQNKTVLVLGGFGLVGHALVRKLVLEDPKQIIVTSLFRSEAEDAVTKLEYEFPDKGKDYFIPWGGDVFVRNEYKDQNRLEILNDPAKRKVLMKDIMEELTPEILYASSIYQLLTRQKPDIIIEVLLEYETAINDLDFLKQNYRFYSIENEGLVEKAEIKAHPSFRDYFLTPK